MHRTLRAPGEPWGAFGSRRVGEVPGSRVPRGAAALRPAPVCSSRSSPGVPSAARRRSSSGSGSAFRPSGSSAPGGSVHTPLRPDPLVRRRPRRPSTRLDTRRRSTRSAHSTPVHSIHGHAHDTPTQAPHTRYAQAQALRSAPASAKGPMPHTPRHASFRPSGTWAAQRINRPTPTQCSLEPTGHLRRPDAYATLTLLRTTPPAPGGPVASAPRPRVVPRDPEHRSRAVEEAGPAGQTPLTPYAPTLPRTHEAASSLHAPEAAFPVPPGSGRRPRWQGGDSARSVYGE